MSVRRSFALVTAAVLAAAGLVGGPTAVPAGAAEGLPGDGAFSENFSSPIHLWQPTMTGVPDGRIFVVGQRLSPASPPFSDLVDAGQAAYFDPGTDTFQQVAPPAHARVGQAVTLADGRIAVFGNASFVQPAGCPYGVGEVYDPNADAWTTIPALAGMDCQSPVSAAALPDGRVLFVARSSAIWNPATNTSVAVPGTAPWGSPQLVRVGTKVLGVGTFSGVGANLVASFDLASGVWTRGAQLYAPGNQSSAQQGLFALDATRAIWIGDNAAVLVDASSLALTPTVLRLGSRPVCGAGVLGTGVPLAVDCTVDNAPGSVSTQVYDAGVGAWRGIPNDVAALHQNAFYRTVTVPSGTYFAGVNGTFDGFVFRRYVPGAVPDGAVRPTVPDAPAGLSASPCCTNRLRVSWQEVDQAHDGGYYPTGYRLTRTGAGPDLVVDLPADQISYTDTLVPDGQGPVTYRVQARNPVGLGPAATVVDSRAPSAVTGLSASGADGKVALSWNPVSQGSSPVVAHVVQRADRTTGDQAGFEVAGSTPQLVDADVVAGHTYRYLVQEKNAQGLLSPTFGIQGFDVVEVTVEAPPNRAPSAADITRSVRGGTAAVVLLNGSDPDGDSLTFSVQDGPAHGTLAGTGSELTYTPDGGYTGADAFTYRADDGRGGTDLGTVAITVTDPVTGTSGVSQDAAAGQSVATANEPGPGSPAVVEVRTPNAGTVSIEEVLGTPPNGFSAVGRQFQIEAPGASVTDPLRLEFSFDETTLPAGETTADVVVRRDGAAIAPCADGSGEATPDPCIADRSSDGGVGRIVVLSSHASRWELVVARRTTTTSLAAVPGSTYGQPVTLAATVAQEGGARPAGTVLFREVTAGLPVVLGSAPLDAEGRASLSGVVLPAGAHQVVAEYLGSATSQPSTSDVRTFQVAKAAVTVEAAPVRLADALRDGRFTYTAVVRSAVTGSPVVGAPVSFRTVLLLGATFHCTGAVTNAQGVATCQRGGFGGLGAYLFPRYYTVEVGATANHLAGTGTGLYR